MKKFNPLIVYFALAYFFSWIVFILLALNHHRVIFLFSDNLSNDIYKGITPPDLINITVCNKLLYNGVTQSGVMFHMIGALSQYGKMGVVCIGKTIDEARAFFAKTIEVLGLECMQK